ncbi:MAG: hypothetical protein ABIZ95_18925 [Pyrinomonadaceae bacterium]
MTGNKSGRGLHPSSRDIAREGDGCETFSLRQLSQLSPMKARKCSYATPLADVIKCADARIDLANVSIHSTNFAHCRGGVFRDLFLGRVPNKSGKQYVGWGNSFRRVGDLHGSGGIDSPVPRKEIAFQLVPISTAADNLIVANGTCRGFEDGVVIIAADTIP